MRIDLKSFLLGIGLILALFIVIGQTGKSSEPTGRYQIAMPQSDEKMGGPFLLDTKTGKSLEWKPGIIGSKGELLIFPRWIIVPMDSLTVDYFWEDR